MKRFIRRTPKVHNPDKLTVGEKAADHVRNGMGSWPFVFIFLAAMGLWAYLNSVVLKKHPFDPYPYVFLNLMLSTLAGLQGAILLIAAKRADQIMDAVIQHIKNQTDKIANETDQIDLLIIENTELTKTVKQALEQNTQLTRQIHKNTSTPTVVQK